MIAAFYSQATSRMRRVADSTEGRSPAQWQQAGHVPLQGEGVLYLDYRQGGWSPDDIQAEITRQTGKIPTNDSYAVVNGLNVIGRICGADPACGDFGAWAEKFPQAQFIANEAADIGWTLVGGLLTAPPESAEVLANQARKAQLAKVVSA